MTPQGQQFLEDAQRILKEVDRARDALRVDALVPSGHVSVGLPTSACKGLSLPLLTAMSQRLPSVSLHIVEAMTGYLDDYIQNGRLDVALLYNHKAFENVAWTEMMVEELMLFVPSDHSLVGTNQISFRDVFELPAVIPGAPNVMRSVIEQCAARCNITPKAVACDSLPAISRMVRDKLAVAIMPHFAFTDELLRGEMVAIPIVDPTPSWRLSVVVSKRTSNLVGSEATARVVADVIAELVSSGLWKAKLHD